MSKYVRHESEAPSVRCVIGLDAVTMEPKRFNSGRCGWYASKKAVIEGERVQLTLIATIIGSVSSELQEKPEQTNSRPKKAPKSRVPASEPSEGEKGHQTP